MEIHFVHVLGTAWISVSHEIFKKPLILKLLLRNSYYGNYFSHILGFLWISTSPKIFEKPVTLECLCFHILFLYYGNPLFPCFANCMDFCLTRNILETHKFEMMVFSHTFSRTMEIHFSHVLEIVWISASPEIFEKPVTLECLYFPILFSYYGNSLFPCFEFWELSGFLLLVKYVRNT